jgi:C4-dicarboxylate-specific signal transduction histidine kinase
VTLSGARWLHYAGAAGDAEQQLHHVQSELAHITTLSEMSASLAHEVVQPHAAIITNGAACLRWLERRAPQSDDVRSTVVQMIAEGRLATEIVRPFQFFNPRRSADARRSPQVVELVESFLRVLSLVTTTEIHRHP